MMSPIPQQNPRTLCIGRDQELNLLRNRFDESARRGQRLVLIRGPAGVGKTKLMTEFRSRMRLEGTVVLEGRCTPGSRALTPLREILRRALSFLEEVGHVSDVELSSLSFLLGDTAPHEPQSQDITPLEQRVRFFDAYCFLLRELSRIKPPLILVHDLQWADTATIELLGHLMDGAGPWTDAPHDIRTLLGLVVASARDDDQNQSHLQLVAHPKTETVDLSGFDEAAMTQFLQTPDVVRRLMHTTGGNPEEILTLVESPAIGADRMLKKRLETLDQQPRRILSALSVLGRPSEVGLVVRVSGLKNAGSALSELFDKGLVIKSVQEGEVVLRLGRHRFGDMMYESLSPSERQDLHSRVVETFSGARGEAAQDLAYHALRAGKHNIAVDSALEAAIALEHSFAYEAATNLLEDARPLAEADQKIEVNRRLAELYNHTGAYNKALDRARVVLETCPDEPSAHLTVGRLYALAGKYDEAAKVLAQVEIPEEDNESLSLRAERAAAQAEVCFRRGNYDEALKVCSEEISGTNSAALLALCNTRGKIELACGNYEEARKIFQENLGKARNRTLVREQAQALINLGIVDLREHDHNSATTNLEEALELTQHIGALRESAIALENLAVLAHFRRDYGSALDYYHAAVSDLKKLGNRSMLARAANNLGELYLHLGDQARALKLAEFSRQVAGETPPQSIVAEGLLLQARVAIRSSELQSARNSLLKASEIFNNLGEKTRHVEAELTLAQLDLDRGDITGARKRLELARSGEKLDQVRRGEAALIEAGMERASFGNPIRALLVAIDCFKQAQDPERLWRAHLRAAHAFQEAGDESRAKRHLGQAAEIEAKISSTVPDSFVDGLRSDPDRVMLRESIEDTFETPTPAKPEEKEEDRPSKPNAFVRETIDPTPLDDATFAARFPDIVFRSPAMKQVLELVERVAPTDSIVLIRGESGTGKELVADAIHQLSNRRKKPFVKVNCAALVETLLLSELFGHEKGAFTGALQRRKGRFEAADGGTLFLDEIGDISPTTQVSLLRVLQEQQFDRVGGSHPIRTDVRIICATNRDLEELVRKGTFREDLYYRLKGIQISLPALRQRPEDIEILANHFLKQSAIDRGETAPRMGFDALNTLRDHLWPGNVRELENVMRSSSLFVDGPELKTHHIKEFTEIGAMTESRPRVSEKVETVPKPPDIPEHRDSTPVEDPLCVNPLESICGEIVNGELTLAQMKKSLEQQCIEVALRKTKGNITQAASLLGMKRPRLSQLVKEHGLLQRERKVKS